MAPPKGSKPWNSGKGAGKDKPRGYVRVRVKPGDWQQEHLLIAERALGKPLPARAQVHHYGAKDDNSKLVICEDLAYHKLLHIRQEAYRATGNANKRQCRYCDGWDLPGENGMAVSKRGDRSRGAGIPRHKQCHTEYERRRRANG